MQNLYRFSLVFGLAAAIFLAASGPRSTATVERTMGYAFPTLVGSVPADPAKVDPRAALAEQLAIVEAAGVPTDGAAVLAVVQQAQGERFNYFDPALRDERGEQIWGKDGAAIPADSMSMLRNRLQAAMVVDFANEIRSQISAERFAAYGFERFTGPVIAGLEDLDRNGAGQNDPRWKLVDAFWAFDIAPRVFAVDEAALAAGLRLTLAGSASNSSSEGLRLLGLAVLVGLAGMLLLNAIEDRRRGRRDEAFDAELAAA